MSHLLLYFNQQGMKSSWFYKTSFVSPSQIMQLIKAGRCKRHQTGSGHSLIRLSQTKSKDFGQVIRSYKKP